MTFIALEGVDGAGKSTLAEAIRDELEDRFPEDDIEYHHYSQLDDDPFDEYALAFEDYAPGQGRHIICDRLHWGELIYGPLYRDASAIDPSGFRWIELYLKARGVTVWEVTAALETIQNRLADRGEEYLESHHVEHVWRGFTDLAQMSLLYGGTADTGESSAKELAHQIVSEAVWDEARAAAIFRPEYIGRHLPNALLVGDTQGNGDPDATRAPFMPRGTSSGRFLLGALQEAWWEKVGIVNANDVDDIAELVDRLFTPPILALGLKAAEALDEAGIEDYSIVPHPQKIRRFHNKLSREYGELIREMTTRGGNKLTWPN